MLPVLFISFNSSYFRPAGYRIESDTIIFLFADLLLSGDLRLPQAGQVFKRFKHAKVSKEVYGIQPIINGDEPLHMV